MILYDRQMEDLQDAIGALSPDSCRSLSVNLPATWADEGRNQLIFGSELAYELGGGSLSAVGGVSVTERHDLVPQDEILLLGQDLPEITGDMPYARIAMIRVTEGSVEDKTSLYRFIRNLEYVRYHIYPQGYMMRISALKNKETVRVRKSDLTQGLSFEQVGNMFLEAYHKIPGVEAVKLVFSTSPDLDYARIQKNLEHSEQITQTLDHLVNKITMDCDACKLQDLCQEVEALM